MQPLFEFTIVRVTWLSGSVGCVFYQAGPWRFWLLPAHSLNTLQVELVSIIKLLLFMSRSAFCKVRWPIHKLLVPCCFKLLLYRCPGGNVPDFGRMFLMLKYTDLTPDTYIWSWMVTEVMVREKCGLLVVPRTVPVSRVVTCTLRMSVLQSHSRVKHILSSLSTDATVTVNCNSILLDIHVPCKVFGTLRTTTALVPVYVV